MTLTTPPFTLLTFRVLAAGATRRMKRYNRFTDDVRGVSSVPLKMHYEFRTV